MPFSNVCDTALMNMSPQKCEYLKTSDSRTFFKISNLWSITKAN